MSSSLYTDHIITRYDVRQSGRVNIATGLNLSMSL